MAQASVTQEARAVHETGLVWGVNFPYPSEEFMSDFAWDVYTDPQHRVHFAAYAMRKLKKADGTYSLNIRFQDCSAKKVDPATSVTVTLIHPSV
jgi:hypothetical protein